MRMMRCPSDDRGWSLAAVLLLVLLSAGCVESRQAEHDAEAAATAEAEATTPATTASAEVATDEVATAAAANTDTAAAVADLNTLATAAAANTDTAAADADAADAAVVRPVKAVMTSKATGNDNWPMWGGTPGRNMINETTGTNLDFAPPLDGAEPKNLLWVRSLGSQTYGNPVVADGKVFVGTNNGGKYRPQYKGDLGVMLAFTTDGEFLWQLSREKLPQGRVNDWPEQGICSAPVVEGDRMWVVTNRAELMCLDTEGFLDGENDGPITDEVDSEKQDADIVWSLDMIEELGVFPHNLATSSPLVLGDVVYLLTSNGVDEAHLELPAPRAPSFLAVNKKTGEIVWEDNTPFDQVLHGQWGSPAVGVVDGKAQVYFPGGDGWLYALDPADGKLIWKFDLNPKDSKWELGGRGTRNAIIATPVFVDNSVVLAVGQDPEHGEGIGHLYRIDATQQGDVTESGKLWHYGGTDEDGSITGDEGAEVFRRTLSTVAVYDGLVYAADLSGFVHCVDFETGKRVWEHDLLAAVWGSPMYVDGHVLLGNEDGVLTIFAAGREKKVVRELQFNSSIYSTPTIAGGVLYISDRSKLYAFQL